MYGSTNMRLAIGLQHSFKSLTWIATLPPILFVLLFKIYLDRTFGKEFRYYIVNEQDLRDVKLHSERADNKGNKLEKRFGHPALHAELFTPMLHAKMMPLLRQVYHGRVEGDESTMDEIVPGGIKIAAVQQVRRYASCNNTLSLN